MSTYRIKHSRDFLCVGNMDSSGPQRRHGSDLTIARTNAQIQAQQYTMLAVLLVSIGATASFTGERNENSNCF